MLRRSMTTAGMVTGRKQEAWVWLAGLRGGEFAGRNQSVTPEYTILLQAAENYVKGSLDSNPVVEGI